MTQNFDPAQLLSIVQRVEKLNEDQAAIAADLKEVLAEAKSAGYDPKYGPRRTERTRCFNSNVS